MQLVFKIIIQKIFPEREKGMNLGWKGLVGIWEN